MSLTVGRGPFGPKSDGVFNFARTGPPHVLYWEPSPRRVRGEFGGETVVDSGRVMLLHETGVGAVYYFPIGDVRMDVLEPTEHTSHCPFKGDARYWSIRVGDRLSENAAWAYDEPIEGCPPIAGYVAFYWDRIDRWFEEDEEVFVRARDPYHRVDALRSTRSVLVSHGGTVLAESRRPVALFESGAPSRFYVPIDDVRMDLLTPSETRTRCPYKGPTVYWDGPGDDEELRDVAWSFPDPTREASPIAGMLCFDDRKVTVEVDGDPLGRPERVS